MTLTLVGDDWQTVRNRVKAFAYEVRQQVGALDMVWNVERNPRGTGHHVQAWQRGDFLDQRDLSRLAQGFGMGKRVHITRWKGGGERYALKEAYAVKQTEQAETFLAMNGGRLTHQTRGYFGGPVRLAEKQAVRAELGEPTETWVVASVAELDAALGKARR